MSVNYASLLVFGRKLNDFITRTPKIEKITKYNEDTGEKYTKEIKKTEMTFMDEAVKDNYDIGNVIFDIDSNLGLFKSHYEDDTTIMGYLINSLDSPDVCEVNELNIDIAKEKFKRVFGTTGNLYLIHNVG